MRYNRFLEEMLVKALLLVDSQDKCDILLNNLFKENKIGKRDRIWVRDRFFFYLRHRLLFDEVSESIGELAKNTAMFFEDEPDETLASKIEFLRKNGRFDSLFNESFSDFLISKISVLYGKNAFLWFNSKAKTVLRANLVKISRAELSGMLENEGFGNFPTEITPTGIVLEPTEKSLKNIELFEKGFFEFQDESSQLASLLVNKNSRNLLEPCAGGGGKSLAIASFFKNIEITASDSRTYLFKEIEERAGRAGTNIKTASFSDISDKFDTVFIDAPCSGSGVLRRNPGDRWKIDEKSVSELSLLQKELIQKFSEKVKKGGELIYVTCSFLESENEEAVRNFLNKNKCFTLVPAKQRLFENIGCEESLDEVTEGDFLKIQPLHERDLMFGAVMKKVD
ncbi:RsmB/NOP family class I SAM-dependent RNA methyltransferase [bacterium]|nr:RsmB/NOP family class I SAM-dependent RNA methyltransferase [bacterium]